MTCPDCEYHKNRAALWRAEAYKQAGHDVIERPWVGLTDEEIQAVLDNPEPFYDTMFWFARTIERKLKEKNT
jgi:2-methylisocitrate lyase-like PEP mutase family enzyme